MARKFLYFVVAVIVLVIGAGLILSSYAEPLTRLAMTPTVKFEAQPPLKANAYDDPAMWFARPGQPGDEIGRASCRERVLVQV